MEPGDLTPMWVRPPHQRPDRSARELARELTPFLAGAIGAAMMTIRLIRLRRRRRRFAATACDRA
jgi:hypothetical protein